EELGPGLRQNVGVDQRPAPDAAAGHREQLLEAVELEQAVVVEHELATHAAPRDPDIAQEFTAAADASGPAPSDRRIAGESLAGRPPPRAALEHQHPHATFGESGRGHRAAKAGAHHHHVEALGVHCSWLFTAAPD